MEALRRLEAGEEFQLVLLDWAQPEGGLPAAKAIRKALAGNIPLILLAESGQEGLEVHRDWKTRGRWQSPSSLRRFWKRCRR